MNGLGAPVHYRSDPRIMPPSPEPRVLITAELLELFDRWPRDDARLERGEDAYRGRTYLAEWPD